MSALVPVLMVVLGTDLANSSSSITSTRRFPNSHFETNDWGF